MDNTRVLYFPPPPLRSLNPQNAPAAVRSCRCALLSVRWTSRQSRSPMVPMMHRRVQLWETCRCTAAIGQHLHQLCRPLTWFLWSGFDSYRPTHMFWRTKSSLGSVHLACCCTYCLYPQVYDYRLEETKCTSGFLRWNLHYILLHYSA